MPIFEYHCQKCGETVEILQKTSKTQKNPCPKCGKPMEKQFSSFSVGSSQSAGSPCCETGSCPAGGTSPSSCPTGTCPFG